MSNRESFVSLPNQAETPFLPAQGKHEVMGKGAVAAIFIISLVAGITAGYAVATFLVYEPQLMRLRADLSAMRTEMASLEASYGSLKDSYAQISVSYSNLSLMYSKLSSDHSGLLSDYSRLDSAHSKLEKDYSNVTAYYKGLSKNVTELYDLLYSYSRIPNVFSRTLDDAEVRDTSSAVHLAAVSPTDLWASMQSIYGYIVSNVKYVNDIDMVYPLPYRHVDINGSDYITEFTLTTCRNYVQTPGLTIEIKQGDCDDQAVLAYAMIKYYMRFIHMTDYPLYITYIEFSRGDGHLAVILPVQGGRLCVIDPAGRYLTSRFGTIASKEALSELQAYSNYWLSTAGSITYMELYSIDVTDGSHRLVSKGTINQVATIFK